MKDASLRSWLSWRRHQLPSSPPPPSPSPTESSRLAYPIFPATWRRTCRTPPCSPWRGHHLLEGGVHGGQCRCHIPLSLGLLVANRAPGGGGGGCDRPIFSDAVLVESEADGVPLLATLKFLEAMHEDEIFATILTLVHFNGVEKLENDNHKDINKISYDT